MSDHSKRPGERLRKIICFMAGLTAPALAPAARAETPSLLPVPGFEVIEKYGIGPDIPSGGCVPTVADGYCVEFSKGPAGQLLTRLFVRRDGALNMCVLNPDGSAYKAPVAAPDRKTVIAPDLLQKINRVFTQNPRPIYMWDAAAEDSMLKSMRQQLRREDFCRQPKGPPAVS